MTQMRELEKNHHEAVTDSALALLDDFTKHKVDDIPDDLRPVSCHVLLDTNCIVYHV